MMMISKEAQAGLVKRRMEPRTLDYIVAACRGERRGGSADTLIQRVCTDSRRIQPGDVFFALRGENFDGHAFVEQVAARASAVVMEKQRAPAALGNCAVVAVEETRAALGLLAQRYRRDFTIPLIAVAGSNGKTTTKEILASVLRRRFNTLWSEASFNNDVGVPLTLLRLERRHETAVLEAGTNHPGELERLLGIMGPHYGIITSIGREHLEFFGDLAGVAREEGYLAECLPNDGKLFLNADSEWATQIAGRSRAPVVTAGFSAGCAWRVEKAVLDETGVSFQVDCRRPEYRGQYRVNLLGRHQAGNALLAIAQAAELGMARNEIERGLAECQPPRMRMENWDLNGVRVLNDVYNANADSMLAALETLRDFPQRGRRIAVLGDMAEVGTQSEAAHEELGRQAALRGVEQLFAVGMMAGAIARGAREAGLARVFEFREVEPAAAAVRSFARSGDVLLLKASRATRLERISDLFRPPEAARKN